MENQHLVVIYPKTYMPKDENDPLLQLEFALKHDGINLEILKQVFIKLNEKDILHHIQRQPTSKYSRRIWFLYELLINKKLAINDLDTGTYVDLLDAKKYYTATSIKSQRHRIKNNLLGNHDFCPMVRKTDKLFSFESKQLDDKAKKLLKKYDPVIVSRASNYLYSKETMSSYEIEREKPDKKRMSRFIKLLKEAPTIISLTKESLIELQNAIVDPRFIDVDYRHSQNYVGEQINVYRQKLHYISPKPEDVENLMSGLLSTLEHLIDSKVNSVIIAAAISFGFVFIHPFEDGNGRIHRFLIHHVLSKCGFTPPEIIFPVSATMLRDIKTYDGALETFSNPLLEQINDYTLTEVGILTVNEETVSCYQYIDYTLIAEYLFSCIEKTIQTDFKEELNYIVNYDKTKKGIQGIVDMPDKKIDLMIKFVIQNNGELSRRKRETYFDMLTEDEIKQIVSIIKEYMF